MTSLLILQFLFWACLLSGIYLGIGFGVAWIIRFKIEQTALSLALWFVIITLWPIVGCLHLFEAIAKAWNWLDTQEF